MTTTNPTATTYSINCTDSDRTPAWMDHAETARPGPQDSSRCAWTVTTTDAAALEAALDADDNVIKYEAIDNTATVTA